MGHNWDMFQPTRAQARRFFFDTWARYRAGLPLEGAGPWLTQHPHPIYTVNGI